MPPSSTSLSDSSSDSEDSSSSSTSSGSSDWESVASVASKTSPASPGAERKKSLSSPTSPTSPTLLALSLAVPGQASPTLSALSSPTSPTSTTLPILTLLASLAGIGFTMLEALPRISWRLAPPPPPEATNLDPTASLTKSATRNQGLPTYPLSEPPQRPAPAPSRRRRISRSAGERPRAPY